MQRVRSDDNICQVEGFKQRAKASDLIGFGLDVSLGDGRSLTMGHRRPQMHLAVLAKGCAAKGFTIDRDRLKQHSFVAVRILVVASIGVKVHLDHRREFDSSRLIWCESSCSDLISDPGVGDEIDSIRADCLAYTANRGLPRGDAATGRRREAGERLLAQFCCDLPDSDQARRTAKGREHREAKNDRKAVADTTWVAGIGHALEPVEQPIR